LTENIFLNKAHSCGERACLLANVACHKVPTDIEHSVNGETFQKVLEEDKKNGLIPFYVKFVIFFWKKN
jgi:hypothetical protein